MNYVIELTHETCSGLLQCVSKERSRPILANAHLVKGEILATQGHVMTKYSVSPTEKDADYDGPGLAVPRETLSAVKAKHLLRIDMTDRSVTLLGQFGQEVARLPALEEETSYPGYRRVMTTDF